jgi:acyl-CoA reductase-like NAD-dependent aldehyde dehydrogenase
MTISGPKPRSSRTPAPARDDRKNLASTVRRLSGVIEIVRTTATMLLVRVPGTVHATRAGAHETASALQNLPDSTLRWLAATSVGLAAGFYLAGAPRLVAAAGVAPALVMGAAIVLRPIEPVVPPAPTR